MTPAPANTKIYHITHVDNLAGIIASGGLKSDALMVQEGGPAAMIGMHHIKARRLTRLPIDCMDGTMVGACVPFYFCPRSVMLYIINRGSHDIAYTGGQRPIVHLQADLQETVEWLNARHSPWAFSLSSAATFYAQFRADLRNLNEVDWEAVHAHYWAEDGKSDRKQAEFLVRDTFPWELFRVIGVHSSKIEQQVTQVLQHAVHKPLVEYRPGWYY